MAAIHRVIMRRTLRTSSASAAARGKEQQREAATATVKAGLQAIAKLDAELDAIVSARAAEAEKIEAAMKGAELSSVAASGLVAHYAETFSRELRTVNPQLYRNKVSHAVFWETVTVPVSAAEKHLGTLELNKISSVSKSVSLGYALKIKESKKR